MKKSIWTVLFLLFSLKIFSYSGIMSGEKTLKTFSTKYFDLIFPIECEKTALKIADVCDSYYLEISQKLGLKPYQRFPVSITRQVERTNAFFSLAPYNLIVFYDAEFDEHLDMYEDTVQSIFYHELTHAVTLNAKSPFWQGMSFFADFFTPAGLSLTSFWFEGAAVLFESFGNGGRLNDPFFTQIAVEAKLKDYFNEKNFPSWRDVSGARDTYPYGNDAYAFGATFAQYLVKTYGFEKYAQFWKNAGTSANLSFCTGVFKRTYNLKLDEVWNDFKESIILPQNIKAQDRKNFISSKNLISKNNTAIVALDLFYEESTGKSKLVWYDSLSNAVYLDGKKLFSAFSVQKLRFSEDGKKLFVNHFVERSNVKSEDFQYDFASQKKLPLKHERKRFDEVFGCQIKKEGLNWSLLYSPTNSNKNARYDFKEKILHNLHFERETEEEISFVFTWAELKTTMLSRIGRIVINKKTLEAKAYLQSQDNPAGILNCVFDGKNYAVVSEEFYSKPLRYFSLEESGWNLFYPETFIKEDFDESRKNPSSQKKSAEEQKNARGQIESQLKKQIVFKDYSASNHFFKGIKLPFSIAGTYKSDFSSSSISPLGITFISSTPWVDKFTILSAGIDSSFSSGGLYASVSSRNDLFSYEISESLNFNQKGFLQSYSKGTLSLVFWRSLIDSASLGINAQTFLGKENKKTKVKLQDESTLSFFEDNCIYGGKNIDVKFFAQYSSLHKASPRYLDYAGFYAKTFFDYQYESLFIDAWSVGKKDLNKNQYANIGIEYGIKIPGVVPVSFVQSFFPQKNYFSQFSLSAILHSFEIQKGIPFFSLYAYRINLKAMYAGAFKYKSEDYIDFVNFYLIAKNISKEDYSDLLRFSLEIVLGPGTSYFASGTYKTSFGTYLQYKFYGKEKNKWIPAVYLHLSV
ncbi:hypothetical protein HRO26_00010 [Treponema pectinovorum]|uniref:hypothetical protein n=1 Tax=Treponema pectinovorum TaxID=164 RepID=UPI003D90FBEB